MLGNDSKLPLLFPLPLQVVYGICISYVRVSSVMKKGNSKTSDNLYLAMISTAASFLSIARTQARLLSLFSSDMASLKFSGLSAVENRKAIRFLNGLTKSISDVFFSGTDNISAISLSFQKTEWLMTDDSRQFPLAVTWLVWSQKKSLTHREIITEASSSYFFCLWTVSVCAGLWQSVCGRDSGVEAGPLARCYCPSGYPWEKKQRIPSCRKISAAFKWVTVRTCPGLYKRISPQIYNENIKGNHLKNNFA